MSDNNQFLPVFVATGVALLGCAAAFYFSDSETSSKRKKTYPIHTKDFDDDIDSYDGNYTKPVKHRKKKHLKIVGGHNDEYDEEDDESEDESEDDDGGNEDDDVESEDDEDDVESEEDDEDDDRFLVNKRGKTTKSKK